MRQKLQGKKTYIIAVLTVIYAILGVILGKFDINTAIGLVLGAGGLAALRNAV